MLSNPYVGILSLVITSILLDKEAVAFQPSYHKRQLTSNRHRTTVSSNNNQDVFADESPEEREERMKLVRRIQGAFYQQSLAESTNSGSINENLLSRPTEEGIFTSVPLFRVQWTELPGYQNILNIHVPHYTHMFRKIMSGPKPWRFGHVYLPGGSENLSNPKYALKEGTDATIVGTLMHISDVFEQKDGRLAMIVQGVEKMQIIKSIQTEPFAIADVQLLPDDEVAKSLQASSSKSSPYKQSFRDMEEWNQWEILPTTWDDPKENGLRGISPLSNYNSHYFPDELGTACSTGSDLSSVEEIEEKIWIALDEMIRLMQAAVSGNVPIPSQLLGLLPTKDDWPSDFQLESYASQLEAKNAEIGTYTKTPFVRASLCESYPSFRRANRLSYVIWILLNTLLSKVGMRDYPSQQALLEISSTEDRLELAHTHLEIINDVLRRA